MKTYKIEMTLELNEATDLEWVFQSIRDMLEGDEVIAQARYMDISDEATQ